jgi:phospholipase C
MRATSYSGISTRLPAVLTAFISLLLLAQIVGCAGSSSSPPPVQQPLDLAAGKSAQGRINHVVIIVQENRTFDNFFGGWSSGDLSVPTPFPGAEATIPAAIQPHMQSALFGDPTSINASHDVWECLSQHNFTDDSWIELDASTLTCMGAFNPITDVHPFYFLNPDLRKSYWDIAGKYVLGDHFFAISSTSSFPGHQYIVNAQSTDDAKQTIADQPEIKIGVDSMGKNIYAQGNGCIDPKDAEILAPVLESNSYIDWHHEGYEAECYGHDTIADRLNSASTPITWRHYSTLEYSDHRYGQRGVFNAFINNMNWYTATLDWPTSMFDLPHDAPLGDLPQVTFIKPPCTALSDHPNGVSTDDAENWVPSVINWIGNSPAWADAAIFVIWDDWGGFYDHVLPPPVREDKLGPGLRIPFLLISPYGANGKVIHDVADYGSILKFIEDLYNLPPLTDVDRDATDMKSFFDFSLPARPFIPVYVKQPFDPTMCPQRADDLSKIDAD